MSAPSRFEAVFAAGQRHHLPNGQRLSSGSLEDFASATFTLALMKKMLPKAIYSNLSEAIQGFTKIKLEYAEPIAAAIKEWAISCGATHYTHWFQPLTGMAAEKHDSFLDWNKQGELIESFSGKQLLQGEPDASSFPSGGLRSTYEARGYTCWDPTSPIFIWKGGDGVTLCIPSLFFSWTGDVLDCKIPLLRSVHRLSEACLRLLRLSNIEANYVNTTIGLEQEYFVIDRALRTLRPDLILSGRTVYGAASPKGQELQDHYFGTVKDRILAYMRDFEIAAIKLGIPIKTRHNEVAPAQHEIAPVFEIASRAIDHNLLLMETMRQVAMKHNLACLLHEKPFAGLNGSGKHCNWALATDNGLNLLNPKETSESNFSFLVLLTAILAGVHRHSALLRAAIGSFSNDYRLGGHEAPPAVISVYLGGALEEFLDTVEREGSYRENLALPGVDLGLIAVPLVAKDNTDRNRTSPFAFTGNKFEFRAVGSSSNPSFAITCLNVAVAEALTQILDEIEQKVKEGEALSSAVVIVVRPWLSKTRSIRFSGNNYGDEWMAEARLRNLPNLIKSVDAFAFLTSPSAAEVFSGILTENELASRQEIAYENYIHSAAIEVRLMMELFQTEILPAAMEQQKKMADSIRSVAKCCEGVVQERQSNKLVELSSAIEEAIAAVDRLSDAYRVAEGEPSLCSKAKRYAGDVLEEAHKARAAVDRLEGYVEDRLWPLPKYRELLFIV
jgi:glutamine synthetase